MDKRKYRPVIFSECFSVSLHDFGKEFFGRWRGVGDGVGACLDGCTYAFFSVPTGCDDRDVRVFAVDFHDYVGCALAGCNVDDRGAVTQSVSDICLLAGDCDNYRNVDSSRYGFEISVAGRGIQDNTVRALTLSVFGQSDCAEPFGQPAADAGEDRNRRGPDYGIADRLLRREWVHRENRIRVAVLDYREISRENQTLDSAAEYQKAGCLADNWGHDQNVVPQTALDRGNDLLIFEYPAGFATKTGIACNPCNINTSCGMTLEFSLPDSPFFR